MLGEMDFVAIDVETANSSYPDSICQIGVAVVKSGVVSDVFGYLVNPGRELAQWQKSNLAISEEDLLTAPSFGEVAKIIAPQMVGPVFSHTSYDRNAITQACKSCGHRFEEAVWLDSAQVVRRAWPEKYSKKGYGLKHLAQDFGLVFTHHDASEDARVAAEIVLRASREKGLSVSGLMDLVRKPLGDNLSKARSLRRDGNLDGPLFGEVVVFTGGFSTSKAEEAEIAAFAGCDVASGVTRKTTMVVVGDDRFAREELSIKWRKALELQERGQEITILAETQFRELIADW